MVGTQIGSYRITKKLGEGGMGEVFVGEHTRIERQVAIKLLHAEASVNPDVVQRFFTEARATSQIRHPGIVEMLDCDVLPDGRAYLVMELLAGETLGQWLRVIGPLEDTRLAVGIALQVTAALGAAHQRGIVHRDLKPDNIFLLADAGQSGIPAVKVLDFGIAKLLDRTGPGGVTTGTRAGAVLGTPSYMSPEQCRGSGTVDRRADVYALGCVLFEMCCGRPPFLYPGPGELIAAHLTESPPLPRTLVPGVHPALSALIGEMLAKDPAARPQTMTEVQRRLTTIDGTASTGLVAPTPLPRTVSLPHTPVPPAVRTPTTLGEAAGHLDDTVPVPPRRRLPFILLGVGALAAAVIWLVGSPSSSSGPVPVQIAPPVAATPPVAASPNPIVPAATALAPVRPAPVRLPLATPDAGAPVVAPVALPPKHPRPPHARPRVHGSAPADLDGLAE